MTKYKMIDPLNEGDEVQFVGVYALKWSAIYRETGIKPTVGFVEIEDDPTPPDALVELMERVIKKIPMGRLYCGQCEEYDHQCGCSPNIVERTRQEFLAAHEKAGDSNAT